MSKSETPLFGIGQTASRAFTRLGASSLLLRLLFCRLLGNLPLRFQPVLMLVSRQTVGTPLFRDKIGSQRDVIPGVGRSFRRRFFWRRLFHQRFRLDRGLRRFRFRRDRSWGRLDRSRRRGRLDWSWRRGCFNRNRRWDGLGRRRGCSLGFFGGLGRALCRDLWFALGGGFLGHNLHCSTTESGDDAPGKRTPRGGESKELRRE